MDGDHDKSADFSEEFVTNKSRKGTINDSRVSGKNQN